MSPTAGPGSENMTCAAARRRNVGTTPGGAALRLIFLREHPLCADPFGDHEGRATLAECVDHIIAHKGDMQLFWDENNWQPLCLHCNSKKAAMSEGRWG